MKRSNMSTAGWFGGQIQVQLVKLRSRKGDDSQECRESKTEIIKLTCSPLPPVDQVIDCDPEAFGLLLAGEV